MKKAKKRFEIVKDYAIFLQMVWFAVYVEVINNITVRTWTPKNEFSKIQKRISETKLIFHCLTYALIKSDLCTTFYHWLFHYLKLLSVYNFCYNSTCFAFINIWIWISIFIPNLLNQQLSLLLIYLSKHWFFKQRVTVNVYKHKVMKIWNLTDYNYFWNKNTVNKQKHTFLIALIN